MNFKDWMKIGISALLTISASSGFAQSSSPSLTETEQYINQHLREQIYPQALPTLPGFTPGAAIIEVKNCTLRLERGQAGERYQSGSWSLKIPFSKLSGERTEEPFQKGRFWNVVIGTTGFWIEEKIVTINEQSSWEQIDEAIITNAFAIPLRNQEMAMELYRAFQHLGRLCR